MKLSAQMIQLHIYRLRDQQAEFLLLKRASREPVYPNLWQVVTGLVEEGETAVQTARREAREETAFECEGLYVLPYVASFFNVKTEEVNFVPVFAAEIHPDEKVTLSDEHQDYCWLEYDKALEMLELPSHREGTRVLKHLLDYRDITKFRVQML